MSTSRCGPAILPAAVFVAQQTTHTNNTITIPAFVFIFSHLLPKRLKTEHIFHDRHNIGRWQLDDNSVHQIHQIVIIVDLFCYIICGHFPQHFFMWAACTLAVVGRIKFLHNAKNVPQHNVFDTFKLDFHSLNFCCFLFFSGFLLGWGGAFFWRVVGVQGGPLSPFGAFLARGSGYPQPIPFLLLRSRNCLQATYCAGSSKLFEK
ncbi:MAG: hypothetical protein A4E50_01663 [Methanosaeta sp. PtaB.Bin087]|nr:MAG: hypothetical protein A4E50_01663 [Methanosaeta sp. PtaB.Bin087]